MIRKPRKDKGSKRPNPTVTGLENQALTFTSPESSHVERGIYNPDGRYLIIIYRSKDGGQAYLYLDVPPETWAAFRAAESKGKFVNTHIIGGKFQTFKKLNQDWS